MSVLTNNPSAMREATLAAEHAESALAAEYPEIKADIDREFNHPRNTSHIIPICEHPPSAITNHPSLASANASVSTLHSTTNASNQTTSPKIDGTSNKQSIHNPHLDSVNPLDLKKSISIHSTSSTLVSDPPSVDSSHTSSPTSDASNQLNEMEFGRLTSPKYLYQTHWPANKELPFTPEDLPSLYVFITTYMNYLVLIICGHINDLIAKYFHLESYKNLRVRNGLAPLVSDFESFYVRRQKHRLSDCFSRITTGVPGRYITVFDRYSTDYNDTYVYTGKTTDCLNLSSYNYLGFAQSVGQCTDAAEVTINKYGPSSGAPRSSGGTTDYHLIAEQVVADFVGKESALIYSMGYGTNATIFSALVDKNCLVISDELNHASIRFGVRMSGAVIRIFKHNDMEDLEHLLREQISQGQPRTHRPWKKILIVVEGLYSMEGTMCNLPRLVSLRRKYKFYLFVDEAHSVGAIGPNGRGVADFFTIDTKEIDIMMGTLTKSFGATGGYIAANKAIVDKLKLTNFGNLYSESAAPPVLAQINSSLLTITGDLKPGEGKERLQRIAFNSRYLRLGLKRLGFIVSGFDDSPIIPLMLYHPSKMPAMSRMMLERKIAVVVVGYPATPLTSSRARLCVSASLTKEDLDMFLREMDVVGTELHVKMSCELSPKTGKLRRENINDVLRTLVDDVQKDMTTF